MQEHAPERSGTMDDIESLCRGFLQNAAARQWAVARVAPEAPTVDYLAGFGDGWEAGHVEAFALVVSMLSGESMTTLIEDAGAQSAVESMFPFDLAIEFTDGTPIDSTPIQATPIEATDSAPPKAA